MSYIYMDGRVMVTSTRFNNNNILSIIISSVLSEWLGEQKVGPPTSIYFTEVKLQMWLRLTELMEDAMKPIRKQMRPYLRELQKNISDRLIGKTSHCHFVIDIKLGYTQKAQEHATRNTVH